MRYSRPMTLPPSIDHARHRRAGRACVTICACLLLAVLAFAVFRTGDHVGESCPSVAVAAATGKQPQLVRAHCNGDAARLSAATPVDVGRWGIPASSLRRGRRDLFIVHGEMAWPVTGAVQHGEVAVVVTEPTMAPPPVSNHDPASGSTLSVVGAPVSLARSAQRGSVQAMSGWQMPASATGAGALDSDGMIAGMVYDISKDGQRGRVAMLDELRAMAPGGGIGAHVVAANRSEG
jgi:hypothetical protein